MKKKNKKEKIQKKAEKRRKKKIAELTGRNSKSGKAGSNTIMMSNKDRQTERRKEQRIPVEIEVKYSTGDSFVVDWTMNISRGGMFIRTPNPLPVGSNLKIYFSVPGAQEGIYAEGIVRWRVEPSDPNVIPGMGVEITNINEDSRNILEEFIRKKER